MTGAGKAALPLVPGVQKVKIVLKFTFSALKLGRGALIFEERFSVRSGSFSNKLFCFLSYFLSQRFPIWDVF